MREIFSIVRRKKQRNGEEYSDIGIIKSQEREEEAGDE